MAIYSGKAQSVKLDDAADMSGAVNLGYSKKVAIEWVPEVAELMPGDLCVGGYVTLDIEIAETGSTNETALEAREGLASYVEVTDRAGNKYVVGPFMLQVGLERDFSDPKNPHIYKLKGRKFTAEPNDLITGPTAP
jgi:hypothetical protein